MSNDKGYRKLKIYEESYRVALTVYEITEVFPKEERYAITNQMRRSSLSIPLNIAEGYAKRSSQQEFRRFLMMAIGSSNEMSVLLDFAKDVGYLKQESYETLSKKYDELSRMLNTFIQAVSKQI